MNDLIYAKCESTYADEIRLVLEARQFKLIQRGKGPGMIEMSFEGRTPSTGMGNFLAAIENALRSKQIDVQLTARPACKQKEG